MLTTRSLVASGGAAVAFALLACVGWAPVGAQGSAPDSIRPFKGRTRAYLNATAYVEPRHVVNASGFLMPFVSDKWQVGLAPSYTFTPSGPYNGHSNSLLLAGIANRVITRTERVVSYLGVYGATREAWSSNRDRPGQHFSSQQAGVHGGALYFLTPSAAVRTELRYRDWRDDDERATIDAIVILDPYLWGPGSTSHSQPPSFGALDVALVADAQFQPERQYSIDATVAPFLTTWLQVGTMVSYVRWPQFNYNFHAIDAFGRLYAPVSSRTMPYVGGLVGNSLYANEPDGLSHYGGTAGVRRFLNPNVALFVEFELLRHGSIDHGSLHFRSPNDATLNARLTTHFPARRRLPE